MCDGMGNMGPCCSCRMFREDVKPLIVFLSSFFSVRGQVALACHCHLRRSGVNETKVLSTMSRV